MKKYFWMSGLFFLLCTSFGLAGVFDWTEIYSFRDQAFPDRAIGKVLIRASGTDVTQCGKVEKALFQKLSEKKVNAVAFLDLFPSSRQYSADEITKGIQQSGADCILNIDNLTVTEVNGVKQRSSISFGGGISFQKKKASDEGIIGLVMKCNMKLTDAASQKTIWVAASHTETNQFGNIDNMAESFAKEMTKTLINDKLCSK